MGLGGEGYGDEGVNAENEGFCVHGAAGRK